MNQRRHLALVAACATLLGAAPMVLVFHQWTWAIDSALIIVGVFLAAMGARALRAPASLQTCAALAGLLAMLTLLHSGGTAWFGIIPGPRTFRHFNDLLSTAGTDISRFAIPVNDTPGLLFLVSIGIGLCAVFNDTVVVGMRRPALAGLPMLAIYAVPVAIDSSSVSFLPFVIAAIGYMWLLVTDNLDRVRLFGRRFTGDGRGVDAWEPSPLAAVGRRIAGIGVVLAVLLPFALPGFTSGLIGVIGTGGGGDGTGTCPTCAGSVNLLLDLSHSLTLSQVELMVEVRNTDASPEYLRLAAVTQITNSGVNAVPPQGPSISGGLPPYNADPYSNGQLNPTWTAEHATITLHNQRQNLLPIFLAPVNTPLGVTNNWNYDPSGSVLFSNSDSSTEGQTYSFDYMRPSYDANELRTAPPLLPDNPLQRALTALPSHVPQVEAIINDPRNEASNEYDRVLKLYDYFSSANGFRYDLTIKPGTTGTDIGNFLTTKRGYCVQYAAALTWLVRAAGYPARVAVGYNQGTMVSPGVWDLTNRDLHAWTEVYFSGYGWVPFDATPTDGGTVYTGWAPNPNQIVTPSTGPSGPTPTGSTSPGAGSGRPVTDPTGPSGATGGGGGGDSGVGWWLLGGLGVLVAAAVSPLLARLSTRRRRVAAAASHPTGAGEPFLVDDTGSVITAARARTNAAWDEFIDTLIDYQVPINLAESPYATSERVSTSLYLTYEVAAQVRKLGTAEQRARYATRLDEPGDLTGTIRSIRRALAARVSTGTKLKALLLPPSVMMRWQATANAWVVAFTARAQVVRENMSRIVGAPRRLLTGRAGR